MKVQGIFWLLGWLPIWATLGTLLAVSAIALFGKIEEKGRVITFLLALSYASVVGATIVPALEILHNGKAFFVSFYLSFAWFHWVMLIAILNLGCIAGFATLSDSAGFCGFFRRTIADPLFFFLILMLAPVVYLNGTSTEVLMTFVVVPVWVGQLSCRLWGWHRLRNRENKISSLACSYLYYKPYR